MSAIRFVHNDGGRHSAGFKGTTGDCACRAIAIATKSDYKDVYDRINELGKKERSSKRRRGKKSSARTGVFKPVVHRILIESGFEWVPTMKIGEGCKVHVRKSELPEGVLVLRLSRHFAAVVNGTLHDTHDSSREGSRCVYGYWIKTEPGFFPVLPEAKRKGEAWAPVREPSPEPEPAEADDPNHAGNFSHDVRTETGALTADSLAYLATAAKRDGKAFGGADGFGFVVCYPSIHGKSFDVTVRAPNDGSISGTIEKTEQGCGEFMVNVYREALDGLEPEPEPEPVPSWDAAFLPVMRDLLECALEGGSRYWSRLDFPAVVKDALEGAGLVLVDRDSGESHKLGLPDLRRGFRLMFDKYPRHFSDAMHPGRMDAITGDVFLQLATFGEVIYG